MNVDKEKAGSFRAGCGSLLRYSGRHVARPQESLPTVRVVPGGEALTSPCWPHASGLDAQRGRQLAVVGQVRLARHRGARGRLAAGGVEQSDVGRRRAVARELLHDDSFRRLWQLVDDSTRSSNGRRHFRTIDLFSIA